MRTLTVNGADVKIGFIYMKAGLVIYRLSLIFFEFSHSFLFLLSLSVVFVYRSLYPPPANLKGITFMVPSL